MFDKLKQQQEKVVRPLLLEMKVRDAIIERLKSDCRKYEHDLKVVNAVIRIPRMTHLFQLALRRKYEAKQYQKIQSESALTLHHEGVKDENQQ